MIQIIVFSKDRACQLELLLRSMKEYFIDFESCDIKILYTYSNENYRKGYDMVKKIYNNILYKKEKSFKSDLIGLISKDKPYTMFLVDDIIFKEFFDIQSLKNITKNVICLSLRLHPNLTYCYALQSKMDSRPNFKKENNIVSYYWEGSQYFDYSYPMSVDGHIFLTNDIYSKILNLSYNSPNTLEGAIASNHIQGKNNMMCFEKSILFNNPCNKVQKDSAINPSGSISPVYLNGMFLDGYRIDLEPYRGFENISCHQEVDIRLIKT